MLFYNNEVSDIIIDAVNVPAILTKIIEASLPILQSNTPSAVSEETVLSNIASQVNHMAIVNSFIHAIKDATNDTQIKDICFIFMQKSFLSNLFATTGIELNHSTSIINTFPDTLYEILRKSKETTKTYIMNFVYLTSARATYNSLLIVVKESNFETFNKFFDQTVVITFRQYLE